jgi:(E)-4-hydroxy-3-methylbut-2-enyl-diphosphate synthase
MTIDKYKYCNSLTSYSRFLTREVKIGDVPLGGSNPIRIQSMTTTDTMNTKATVEQAIRMIDAGCEYVRITAPSLNEAQNLAVIKQELLVRGYKTPLIADIHFTPNAAELAARIVEKVRINPGNYADRKKFENIEYTDDAYDAELERIRNRFTPLVKICKEYGTAMRIGTNHGSLSDRIMSRYGDTPLGMVESALEFVRICEDLGYYDIVLSMKSSNPQVMVHAYRLLVHKMMETERNYPLHLGVTEAGEGEDGRIKSAIGIGTLLEDGLGDTIRVSLTEDPEFEIPIAKAILDKYIFYDGLGYDDEKDYGDMVSDYVVEDPNNYYNENEEKDDYPDYYFEDEEETPEGMIKVYSIPEDERKELDAERKRSDDFEKACGEGRAEWIKPIIINPLNPFEYNRRVTNPVLNIGGNNVPVVISDLNSISSKRNRRRDIIIPEFLEEVGYKYDRIIDKWNISDMACDYIWIGANAVNFEFPGTLGVFYFYEFCPENHGKERFYPAFSGYRSYHNATFRSPYLNLILMNPQELTVDIIKEISKDKTVVLNLQSNHYNETSYMADIRRAIIEMINQDCKTPVIAGFNYSDREATEIQLDNAIDFGSLLIDGLIDGIWIDPNSAIKLEFINRTAFGILQATRTRISKTEYISCPSCGRTLFDLQETTAKIRSRTNHLKGVKIAIMGCIVNGPGEMADADYGYVGTGIGKITLYRGKDVVKRSIEADLAVDALIDLIKEDGIWIEKA